MFEFDPYSPKTLEYTETKNGTLRGFRMKGIYTFLNVQYGECRRWEAPEPVKPWKGIKNAVRFGPRMFPGAVTGSAPVLTPWDSCGIAHEVYDYAEDALNLNIWSPTLEKTAKKPVMVWIHGGGYATGSAMEMQAHYGSNLSEFGDVVVVTINHRLNVFGFMDMSRFGEKYANSVNAGIADLVCALQWIHDNIENFGGDPDNVLIFGQSGGGGKVCTLMQTPAAAGLFHKAVIMSGVAVGQIGGPKNISDDLLDRLLEKYHTDSIDTLLALTPEELLDSVNELGKDLTAGGLMGWHPVANGWYLGDAREVGTLESSKNIPVMIGSTISEFPNMRIFNKHSYTEEQQMDILKECFPGQDVEKLAELFHKAWPEKCLTDAIEIKGWIDFREGTIQYLDVRAKEAVAPTYSYIFGYDFPQDGGRGAWHCADIPVVFHNACAYPENFREGLVGDLENAISGSWVNFAHTGDPNNQWLGTQWPAYKEGECAVMIFDKPCTVRYDFDRELVAFRNAMDLKITDKYTKFNQVIN
ncbi:MAG: carboxylesterase/lipase family protein [Solobacterium sp.]|nr:carboxylesterase/lipase family protein [Solobacterium sp.]